MEEKKNRPICPECKQQTIVLFTPPKEGAKWPTDNLVEYIDWERAHLYCCNGETNCKYTAHLMNDRNLTTP